MAHSVTARCLMTSKAFYTAVLVFIISYFLIFSSGISTIVKHRVFTDSGLVLRAESKLPGRSLQNVTQTTSVSTVTSVTVHPPVGNLTLKANDSLSDRGYSNGQNITKPPARSSHRDFQTLHDDSIFLYSAYYRAHQPPVVTVLALVNRMAMNSRDARPLSCVYHDSDAHNATVQGRLSIFGDHHGKQFGSAFIHCPVPESLIKIFSLSSSSVNVSIATPRDKSLDNALRVHLPHPRQYKFLICFSPLHHQFSNVVLVVENLELAQVLGAEHAIVYNNSIAPAVNKALNYYISKGFLEIKNWRDPPESIHYQGQMGANNDCLLHNHNRTDFIILMDFDEMIVPRVHQSWSALMEALVGSSAPSDFVKLDKNSVKLTDSFTSRLLTQGMQNSSEPKNSSANVSEQSFEIGAVSFPNCYFLWDKPTNLTDEELRFAQHHRVPFLLKQRRKLETSMRRTKTIVNPRVVDVTGIHKVFTFLGGQKTLYLNESIGLMQHYRWQSKGSGLKDTNILRFAPTLVRRMKIAFKEIDAMPWSENVRNITAP